MGALVVNLDEFSELCGVTAETMRVHIRAIADDPRWLLERGKRGSGYKIEPEGGLKWWRKKQEAAAAEIEDHQEKLAQLRLDILGGDAEGEEELSLSGRQRREEYAATVERIKLRRMMGELVDRAELDQHLSHAAVEARRRLGLVPGEFAAETGASRETVQVLERLIERAAAEFVSKLSVPDHA